MNLILFTSKELNSKMHITLEKDDIRAVHLKKVLKAEAGSSFDAGIVNGAMGKAVIVEITDSIIEIIFKPGDQPTGLHPLTLILGLSRPPTVKKVLKEATALGVKRFILCGTENGERSYIQSSALKAEKIHDVLIEGAQQAVCTMMPQTSIEHSLRCALELIKKADSETILIALDNYEASISLTDFWQKLRDTKMGQGKGQLPQEAVLAVGSERGWTDRERSRLRDAGFTLCSLGPRVLRTETASIAGSAVCLSGMGII